jgi:hypothetical protein
MLRSAIESKALTWMECVRPSLVTLNIFDKDSLIQRPAQIQTIMQELFTEDVHLDFAVPFEMNVDAACKHLGHWLINSSGRSDFSIVGLFSSFRFIGMLQQNLGAQLGNNLRLLVYLTTFLFTGEDRSLFCETKKKVASMIRDWVGNAVLEMMDSKLKPAGIDSSRQKYETRQALFLLILGAIIAVRYTPLTPKSRELLRLLSHYLAMIGKNIGLFEDASAEFLVNKCETQWDKAACYTWHNPKKLMWEEDDHRHDGSHFIDVECPEAVDLHYSNLEADICEFVADSDLVKCTLCGIFWSELDTSGHCRECQSAIDLHRPDPGCSFSNQCSTSELFSDSLLFDAPDFSEPSNPMSLGPLSTDLSTGRGGSHWAQRFCLSCYRQIDVGEYCSQACRLGDSAKTANKEKSAPAPSSSSDSSASSFYLPLRFQVQDAHLKHNHSCEERNAAPKMNCHLDRPFQRLAGDAYACVRHCSMCGDVFVPSLKDDVCSTCNGVGMEGFLGLSLRLLI